MIQIIKRSKHNKRLDIDNGDFQKPIKQICKNCNCTISISNIFDFYIKKNCYAEPLYMIDPYELAFKCPNCTCQITLSSFNDRKVKKFLKKHNTDIYDLSVGIAFDNYVAARLAGATDIDEPENWME